MRLIEDWQNKNLRCWFCGTDKSVKYSMEYDFGKGLTYNPCCSEEIGGGKYKIFLCDKCSALLSTEDALLELEATKLAKRYIDCTGECARCISKDSCATFSACRDFLDFVKRNNIQKEKETAKEILQTIYDLCKERGQIQWDDVYYFVKKYGVKIDE